MAACATAPAPARTRVLPSPDRRRPDTQVQTRDGVTPPFMRGRHIVRVGLLLPFSLRPQDAAALYNAAELALFDHGNAEHAAHPARRGRGRSVRHTPPRARW